MEKLRLPTPSLSEQRKIATVLYTVDRAIEKSEEITNRYTNLRKGLISTKTTGSELIEKENIPKKDVNIGVKKRDIPEAWNVITFEDVISDLRSGLSRKLKSKDIGIPVIISGNIQNGKFDPSELKYWYVDDPKGANTDDFLLEDNDILINFINSPKQIGKSCMYSDIGRPSIFTTNVFRVRTTEDILQEYLYYYTQSYLYQSQIDSITQFAVNQASFSQADLKSVEIPLPPLQQQEAIINQMNTVDKIIESERQYKSQLQRLKRGLMQDLLSGTVRTTDTNMEVPDKITQHG